MKALINHGSDCSVSGPIGRGREEEEVEEDDGDDDDDDVGGGAVVAVVVRLLEVGQVRSEWTRE